MAKKKSKFEKVLASFPNRVAIDCVYKKVKGKNIAFTLDQLDKKTGVPVVSPLEQGIIINYSMKDFGFGQITLWQKNGELYLDAETSGKELAMIVLCGLVKKAKLVG